MNNAFYITLSKQTALFRHMGVIANNIANSSTDGYKAEKMLFSDYVAKDADGGKISFAYDIATARDMSQGPLINTGAPLDAAIQGDGFFTVETPQGPRYTRVGSFSINSSGELVSSSGHRLLGNGGGPIAISEGSTDISIREDGMVQAFVAGALEEVGVLGVVKFEDKNSMKIEAGGLYDGNAVPATIEDYKVIQGALEQSNVNAVQEVTQMIEVSRSASTTAQFVKDLHELVRRAIETISQQA